MSDTDILLLRQKYRRDNNLDFISVVLGDQNGLVPDNAIPGNVWVTAITSNGQSKAFSVRGPSKPILSLKANTSVTLEYDKRHQLRVADLDGESTLAAGSNPVGIAIRSESDRVQQVSLETLAVIPTSPPSLRVYVKAWNPTVNNIYYEFPGGEIDLTEFVPSDENEQCIVVIFVTDTFDDLVGFASTSIPNEELLGKEDVQECIDQSISTYTSVYGIRLKNGQDTISLQDITNYGKDLRGVVNVNSTASVIGGFDRIITSRVPGQVVVSRATGNVVIRRSL